MCLVAWCWQPVAAVPLIVAANRDESWDRPTLPLQCWRLDDGSAVLSGRDARAGGAWLAWGEYGRLAMLTNVRAWPPEPAAPRSRGQLVVGWLRRSAHGQDWRTWLRAHPADAYNGCNLVLADLRRGLWVWLTNRDPAGHDPDALAERHEGWWGRMLPAGVHALSNAALDTPWPKALALAHAVRTAASEPDAAGREATLLASLRGYEPGPDPVQHLQRSPWVWWPERRYGTRSSLVAQLDRAGTLQVAEWTYDPALGPSGAPSAEVRRSSIAWCGMPTSS
ncbi:NRDE family protein [Tepidimonas aquatica]|uniref:Transport and Golgi organization 2 n=1 Tax=Tepidimonas aquatica TaxID=247482 RepID=A0A554W9L6_9BURK|nr:NRDE family protein [Tepidimonas aquatica]TSE20267.1 Transport and Golgi organization 2 [Tepidimonas aquatica]